MINRKLCRALVPLVIVYCFCLFVTILSPYSYSEMCGKAFDNFSALHILGTDAIGRDVLVRNCAAALTSIHIAVISVACGLFLGLPYGCLAGYKGGMICGVMTAILDVIEGIPDFLIAMMLMTFINGSRISSDFGIFVTLTLLSWTSMARIIKNETQILKNKNFIKYSIFKDASFRHIFRTHLFPNLRGTILSVLLQKIPSAIFLEAFLSFIGIGIQPPKPSLGKLISEGMKSFRKAPALLVVPSIFLLAIVLGFNLLAMHLEKENGESFS